MLRRWLLNRAAKAYASRLPGQLHRDYGPKETYSLAQVHHAIDAAHLDERYAILAYARFFPVEVFEGHLVNTAVLLDYETARALFIANEEEVLRSRNGSPDRNYGNRGYDPGPKL
ncbi:MAG: hypothetical protein JSR60_15910 [Proteobacteria bacterium]|nr:hypothetical protein [Pseudomonadota bacterium]